MAAQWILAELVTHQSIQAVESFVHVHAFDGDVDLGCRTQTKRHAVSAMRIRRPSSASPNAQSLAILRPLQSINTKPVPASGGASNFTLTKRCFEWLRRRRWRPNVLRTIPLCRQYSLCVSPLA